MSCRFVRRPPGGVSVLAVMQVWRWWHRAGGSADECVALVACSCVLDASVGYVRECDGMNAGR